MRVMVIVKATNDSEAGKMPTTELLAAMGNFNEELVKAGVMLAGEGLHPSAKGKRVRFSGNQRTVTDGPFPQTNELVAGFWLWQVKSMDEAVEWVRRCPNPMEGESEIESARCSRSRTSALNSRPNCVRRKSDCALRSKARTNRADASSPTAGGDSRARGSARKLSAGAASRDCGQR